MNYFDLVQWPAMVLTAIAAWLVGSRSEARRNSGFGCFFLVIFFGWFGVFTLALMR
jgi:hypothetical protein